MPGQRRFAPEHRPLLGLEGRRCVVLGLGRFGGGVGAARFLQSRGAKVIATDLRTADELPEATAALGGLANVELALGGHRAADLEAAELIVANPAVPRDSPWLALGRCARITTEIELLLAHCNARRIGITGTQGKTSTASFTAALLRAAGRDVRLGGNLGGSLLDELETIGPRTVLVLELSSYQLEHLGVPPANSRAFDALAVTGLLDDHLERHGGRAGYSAAKRRLLELGGPDSLALIEARLAASPEWSAELAAFDRVQRFDESWLAQRIEGPLRPHLPPDLPPFQRANAALALELARSCTDPDDEPALQAALPALRTPEHRAQTLAPLTLAGLGCKRGELRVIDNGVSTTPDSSAAVVAGLPGPLLLLVGGHDKRLDLAPLLTACRGRLARAFTFGAAGPAFRTAFESAQLPVECCPDLDAAVDAACAAARGGETLLFSPAAASFDAYPNFRERALAFRRRLELQRGRRSPAAP